ncbi:Signal recognition particle receptor subunit beta Ecym_8236 [Eremothecium cymbalariae DBVPG|uniref:Signal recognition particle receptor subunit beta n=1 Tax=Eremothecium cymbalariae (strain CBS 270.75 / DBVPG 7215 / KCTC 17166 / NRRL Y-17582) TaxID=931890 RepID=G8JXE7_ERECY|nr:Hypothetical protein Ecym_8236 [Eremothecium cymbalariae DBVPG\
MDNTLLIALVVILITSGAVLIVRRNTDGLITSVTSRNGKKLNRDPTFIIAGPSSSGKTSLFSLLTTDEIKPTLMSQQPNIALDFLLPSATKNFKFKLIEFPGHPKLQHDLFQTLRDSIDIRGLIFLVDSTVDPKELTTTAELLYEVLKITERRQAGVDILIACNKSESFASRPPMKIKQALEKEIDSIMLRKKKSLANVSTQGDSHLDHETHALDIDPAGGFKFECLEGTVDALDGSVLKNKVVNWKSWIDLHAVN